MTGLRRDTSGQTTVAVIFMFAFLMGGIWYLVGLGEAMVFHEQMQDAADATGFAPSVIQARGMNVLALLNLVMSAILAVLVAVKIGQLLLLAANVIACAIPFNPHCPLLSSWENPYGNFTKITDKTVSTVNKGLYSAETAIAKTVPVIGQAKAKLASREFAPVVEGGFTASASLVPSGERFGLPVEDEEYKNLCAHAAEGIGDLVFKPIKFLPGANVIVAPVLKYVGGLVGKLAKAFPGYFCGGGGLGLSGLASLGDAFKDIAKDVATKGLQSFASNVCKQAMSAASKATTPIPGLGDPLSATSCASGVTSSFGSITSPSALGGPKQTSKRIFRPAAIGSDYYASYGFVFSRYLEKHSVENQLSVVSLGKKPPMQTVELDRLFRRMQVSKTEFYFDPRAKGPSSWLAGGQTGGAQLRDEALLHMRWRARLRKYRPPTTDLRGLMTGSGLGSIVRSMAGVDTVGMNPASMITTVLGNPNTVGEWADRHVGGISDPISRTTSGILH